MPRLVLLGMAFMFFVVGTFASWYQGSKLLDDSFEWKHTAVITNWLHDGELKSSNISQLDFFIYSLKFQPVYPVMMLISFVYILFAVGEKFLKRGFSLYVGGLAVLLFFGAMLVSGSPTDGAKLFMFALIGTGSALMGYLMWKWGRDRKVIA